MVSDLDSEDQKGYLFENHTGVRICLAVHDPSASTTDTHPRKPSDPWINDSEWSLSSEVNGQTFMSESVL
jgi:hypothetical protein